MPAFWDTSAIVHLCVPGQGSSAARRLLREHAVVIWWCTPVEARSALARLDAEGAITPSAYVAARKRVDVMLGAWREIQPTDFVRDLAISVLEQFHLRAADSFQLAAALAWCKQKPQNRILVSNDAKLLTAAGELGFDGRSV